MIARVHFVDESIVEGPPTPVSAQQLGAVLALSDGHLNVQTADGFVVAPASRIVCVEVARQAS